MIEVKKKKIKVREERKGGRKKGRKRGIKEISKERLKNG